MKYEQKFGSERKYDVDNDNCLPKDWVRSVLKAFHTLSRWHVQFCYDNSKQVKPGPHLS